MSVYLELFHGRKSVTQQLDDWGSEGPILGPLAYVHTTYAADIKIETATGSDGVLYLCGDERTDLLHYDGFYYGDWTVFGAEVLEKSPEINSRVQQFDPAKAEVPENEVDARESRPARSGR